MNPESARGCPCVKARPPLRRWLLLLACLAASLAGMPRATGAPAVPRTGNVAVPLDHRNPAGPSADIGYELGAAFDAAKPTVFVIADAQQFHVRPGAMPALQDSLFGEGFNVVGIIGRGSRPMFIRAARGADGRIDWLNAWRVFNSVQWVEDIEVVRRRLLGAHGKVLLYGRSGGAFLIHQYLAVHGDKVARAWTQAPLNPFIAGELGLRTDHFWEEIGASDASLQPLLRQALEQYPDQRARWMRILQRQNFFVPLDRLDAERSRLIRAMAANDHAVIDLAASTYQVDAVERLMAAPEGIAITIRLYEFQASSRADTLLPGDGIRPELETFRAQIAPLLALQARGLINPPAFNATRLHGIDAEVMVLAGRYDHTADYRVLISLAARYPRGHLFIANDNHVFEAMNRQGHATRLLRAFLSRGTGSADYRKAESDARDLRWRE